MKWTVKVMCADSLLFSFEGPGKGVRYMPCGAKGQCPLFGLWLLTRYILNTILSHRGAGLHGVCELVETNDGGRGSTSSSSLVGALYSALSLSESVTIACI